MTEHAPQSHQAGEPSLGRFRWEQTDEERTIYVHGEVDLSNACQLLRSLEGLGERNLVVDLADVSFMDSTGLGILVRMTAQAAGEVELRLREGSQIDRLLSITGLRPHFKVETAEPGRR